MPDEKDEGVFAEWDKMFDSLHESDSDDAFGEYPNTEKEKEEVEEDDGFDESPPTIDKLAEGDAPESGPFEDQRTAVGDLRNKLVSDAMMPTDTMLDSIDDEMALMGVPEALGGLLGSEGVESPDRVFDADPGLPSAIAVRAGQEKLSRETAVGPDDAALDDFESDLFSSSAPAPEMRSSKSAEAFFEEDGSNEVSLELDDDFYDGFQVGAEEADAEDDELEVELEISPVEEEPAKSPPQRRLAHTVRRTPVPASDGIPVAAPVPQTVASTALPSGLEEVDEEAVTIESVREVSESVHRPDLDDDYDLTLEVGSAVDEMSAEVAQQAPRVAVPVEEVVLAGVIHDPLPDLGGIVDAAVEDAVAMSTGTLQTGPRYPDADVEPDLPPPRFLNSPPSIDLDGLKLPDLVDPASADRTEELVALLSLYEREAELLDETNSRVRLLIETARLAECLGDLDQARHRLDEALTIDPRLVPANRALRRIERLLGNWDEVLNQLDLELAKASPMEHRALAGYRADLLIATGEQDLARVAVGELLDNNPVDTRALVANLELAFVDGRDEEIEAMLNQLIASLREAGPKAALLDVSGAFSAHGGDFARAKVRYREAFSFSPGLGSCLGEISAASRCEDKGLVAAAATHACDKLERSEELSSALAWLQAETLAEAGGDDEASQCLVSAAQMHPDSVLVNFALVRSQTKGGNACALGWRSLARATSVPVWKAQCLSQAGHLEVDPDGAAFSQALEVQPDDEFSRSALRRQLAVGGAASEIVELDRLACETKPENHVLRYRLAQSLLESGEPQQAMDELLATVALGEETRATDVFGLELAYATGRQEELRQIHTRIASITPGAGDDAMRGGARAATRIAMREQDDALLNMEAAESWRALAELGVGRAAHNMAFAVANSGSDHEMIASCASYGLQASHTPDDRLQFAVELAGRSLLSDRGRSREALEEALASGTNARAAELLWVVALVEGNGDEAANALEAQGRSAEEDSRLTRADCCRYRAATLRLQHDIETALAVDALTQIVARRPEFRGAHDLLLTGAGKAGPDGTQSSDRSPVIEADGFASDVRRAEGLAASGDYSAASEIFADLHREHPDDILVRHGFESVAYKAESPSFFELALADLKSAEDSGSGCEKAKACEVLARIDGEARGDAESALRFWEAASQAAPERRDLVRILEREYAALGSSKTRSDDMRSVVGRIIAGLEAGPERSAYLLERARLSEYLGQPETVVAADYQAAFEDDLQCRRALLYLERRSQQRGVSEELAGLEGVIAGYFSSDERARAAFLVRSGETWRSLKQHEQALARFKSAATAMPGFAPALFGWRDLALDHELWRELADACLLEAESVAGDAARAQLGHLAGVTLMDKVDDAPSATAALRGVLAADPAHRDAFIRLRKLYTDFQSWDELARLLSRRLLIEADDTACCELHQALADVYHEHLSDSNKALVHLHEVLELRANDMRAVVDIAEIAWELGAWPDAAEALMQRARLERDPESLKMIFLRLGTIYSEHLPDSKWALRSFKKVIGYDPTNIQALEKLAQLGVETGDHKLALGASEQLIKQDPPADDKIRHLHRIAGVYQGSLKNPRNAERALRIAIDLNPASDLALDGLVKFYLDQGDSRSARVHSDRIATAMRTRLAADPTDATAAHVIARAMAARARAGVKGSVAVAKAAAELAVLLGDESLAGEQALTAKVAAATQLASGEHDDLLYPEAAQGAVRALFGLLGDRLAKHVGTDVRHHGVGRSDRVRKGSDPIAAVVMELTADMGIDDIDLYISEKKRLIVAAVPTKPISVILGRDLVSLDRPDELRFLIGRSVKLAAARLSVPVQLGKIKLGILLVGILRQFNPEFEPPAVDATAAAAEQQRLRRLIPSSMLNELRPYAAGLATGDFDHQAIWQALTDAGNRAGLLCAGSVAAGIKALMRRDGITSVSEAMKSQEISALARFAVSEDHSLLWDAIRSSQD